MTFGQQGRSRQDQRRNKARRSPKVRSFAAHRAFAPLLGAWGALVGGLTTMAVSPVIFAQAIRGTPLDVHGIPIQPAVAVVMAMLFGSALLGLAHLLYRRSGKQTEGPLPPEDADRRARLIDPLRDLGSNSLDDPLEDLPFATPTRSNEVIEADQTLQQSVFEPVSEAAAEPVCADAPAPREIDLAEFGRIPGRNGVWIEEAAMPEPIVSQASVSGAVRARRAATSPSEEAFVKALRALRPGAPRPAPGTAALSRLRSLPLSELSLLEMVERFAGALHEHRVASPSRSLDATELASREAALAEALKALGALSAKTEVRSVAPHAEEPVPMAAQGLEVERRLERGAA